MPNPEKPQFQKVIQEAQAFAEQFRETFPELEKIAEKHNEVLRQTMEAMAIRLLKTIGDVRYRPNREYQGIPIADVQLGPDIKYPDIQKLKDLQRRIQNIWFVLQPENDFDKKPYNGRFNKSDLMLLLNHGISPEEASDAPEELDVSNIIYCIEEIGLKPNDPALMEAFIKRQNDAKRIIEHKKWLRGEK